MLHVVFVRDTLPYLWNKVKPKDARHIRLVGALAILSVTVLKPF